MPENDTKAAAKPYRVSQIEGKITWKIEELWTGGVVRGPYGSKESAIRAETEVANKGGFADALVLQDVAAKETAPADAFKKDANGKWECVMACAIDIENKEIVFTEGMTFSKGSPFMGVDVVKWLEEHTKK